MTVTLAPARRRVFDYMLVLPAVTVFTVFVLWPAVNTFITSLYENRSDGGSFIGLANYREMLGDPVFWIAFNNNIKFIFLNLVFQAGLGVLLAALIDRGIRRFSTVFRTIIFAPLVIAPVAIGVLWTMLLEPNFGFFKQLTAMLGMPFPREGILGNPDLAFPAIVAVGTWNYIGFMMTIILAAMQGIPRELYEAARMDGAGPLQTFFYITLPGIRQALIVCTLLIVVGSFKTFDHVFVLTRGGPGNETQVLGTYIVESAFASFRPNYAAAMSSIVLIVAILFGSLQVLSSPRNGRS